MGDDREFAVGVLPTLRGKRGGIRAAPALRGLAVPQQAPALRLLLGVEIVRQVVADQDSHGRRAPESLCLHDEVLPRGGTAGLFRRADGVHLQTEESLVVAV